ncbi:SPRY domain-containing protein [endosymbiont GvMRE of Glomus versiforme]|uniref:SPRY domain-containing protein n=1 Tax=endosymbiont GvMRE of Glomus versiforme TaxID=2039283 RepID=UPI001559A9C0|nr:SPRY domain-containing protein [endosymbiont GvMRE of Glomus versiforme]
MITNLKITIRFPGWHKESVAYHSDDGNKFCNNSYGGQSYSETWGEIGDVIGCGYYPQTGIVFFTKNGKNLGNAFCGVRHTWFPAVSSDNKCRIECNFSGEKEFEYKGARNNNVAGYFPKKA